MTESVAPSKNATRDPDRERRHNTKRRLEGTARRLDAARRYLMELHSDRSGIARRLHRPPFLNREWLGREQYAPGLAAQFERIRREAAQGCDLSSAFLEEWQQVFDLCDRLRQSPPPERAADFEPLRVARSGTDYGS